VLALKLDVAGSISVACAGFGPFFDWRFQAAEVLTGARKASGKNQLATDRNADGQKQHREFLRNNCMIS
jgi:hypothetical protein